MRILFLAGIIGWAGVVSAQEDTRVLVGSADDNTILYVAIAGLFSLLAVGVFGYILWKFRQLRTEALEREAPKVFTQVLRLVVAGFVIVTIMGIALSYFSLSVIKRGITRDLEKNLVTLITSANHRLDAWTQQQAAFLSRAARDPQLVSATRDLILGQYPRSLLNDPKVEELRAFFNGLFREFNATGFYIVTPQGINIATETDINKGWKNIIAEQKPDLLARVFAGETLFIAPLTSEIPLPGISTPELTLPPAMFFAVPVQEIGRAPMAVLVVRVNPAVELTRLLALSRFRSSGETYAFNTDGFLLSDIRFKDQVKQLGLVPEPFQVPFNLELLDPGGNLLAGYRPTVERRRLPHTLPVLNSLAITLMGMGTGTSDIVVNTIGYNDYRGVNVFGAWVWNYDLDLGIVSKIDANEALGHFFEVRFLMLLVLVSTLSLTGIGILIAAVHGKKANDVLARSRDELEAQVADRTAALKENQERFAVLMVASIRGIRERKSADERFKVLFEQSSDAHVLFGENGIIDCNSAAIQLMGAKDKSDLLSRHPAEFSPQHQPDGRLSAEKAKEMDALANENGHHRFDWVHRRLDGTEFPVEVSLTPVTLENRQVLLVVWHDLTERKRMEDALKQEQKRLQDILDTSPVGVAFSSGQRLGFVNPKFRQMFGADVGRRSPDLHVDSQKSDDLIRRLAAGEEMEHLETRMKDRTGQVRDILASFMSISYEGRDGTLAWMLDITDRKRSEQEIREKLEELTRFRRLVVGREEKMIELKTEINGLLKKAGLPEKYNRLRKEMMDETP